MWHTTIALCVCVAVRVCMHGIYGIDVIRKTQLCKAEALAMGYGKQLFMACLWACLARFAGGP